MTSNIFLSFKIFVVLFFAYYCLGMQEQNGLEDEVYFDQLNEEEKNKIINKIINIEFNHLKFTNAIIKDIYSLQDFSKIYNIENKSSVFELESGDDLIVLEFSEILNIFSDALDDLSLAPKSLEQFKEASYFYDLNDFVVGRKNYNILKKYIYNSMFTTEGIIVVQQLALLMMNYLKFDEIFRNLSSTTAPSDRIHLISSNLFRLLNKYFGGDNIIVQFIYRMLEELFLEDTILYAIKGKRFDKGFIELTNIYFNNDYTTRLKGHFPGSNLINNNYYLEMMVLVDNFADSAMFKIVNEYSNRYGISADLWYTIFYRFLHVAVHGWLQKNISQGDFIKQKFGQKFFNSISKYVKKQKMQNRINNTLFLSYEVDYPLIEAVLREYSSENTVKNKQNIIDVINNNSQVLQLFSLNQLSFGTADDNDKNDILWTFIDELKKANSALNLPIKKQFKKTSLKNNKKISKRKAKKNKKLRPVKKKKRHNNNLYKQSKIYDVDNNSSVFDDVDTDEYFEKINNRPKHAESIKRKKYKLINKPIIKTEESLKRRKSEILINKSVVLEVENKIDEVKVLKNKPVMKRRASFNQSSYHEKYFEELEKIIESAEKGIDGLTIIAKHNLRRLLMAIKGDISVTKERHISEKDPSVLCLCINCLNYYNKLLAPLVSLLNNKYSFEVSSIDPPVLVDINWPLKYDISHNVYLNNLLPLEAANKNYFDDTVSVSIEELNDLEIIDWELRHRNYLNTILNPYLFVAPFVTFQPININYFISKIEERKNSHKKKRDELFIIYKKIALILLALHDKANLTSDHYQEYSVCFCPQCISDINKLFY